MCQINNLDILSQVNKDIDNYFNCLSVPNYILYFGRVLGLVHGNSMRQFYPS